MPLFFDLGGATYCLDHAGQYLKSAVQQMPNRSTYNTPITSWQRIDPDGEFADLTCETCGCGVDAD